jgi:hypothetical protein
VDKPRLLYFGTGKPHLLATLDAFWWIAQRLRIMHAKPRRRPKSGSKRHLARKSPPTDVAGKSAKSINFNLAIANLRAESLGPSNPKYFCRLGIFWQKIDRRDLPSSHAKPRSLAIVSLTMVSPLSTDVHVRLTIRRLG